MSNARVLYINLTGVTCEMMKNLILAGVAAVVCDPRPYPDAVREVPSSFFRAMDMETIMADRTKGEDEPDAKKCKACNTVAQAVAPKIDELNPLLVGRNSVEERPISLIPDEYFGQFNAVVASRLSVAEATRISLAIERHHEAKTAAGNGDEDNTLFIVADTFGLDGCAHLDFGSSHRYRSELGRDKLSDPKRITPYITMANMLNLPLTEATGRWDKTPPRTLVLHRLFIDYWSTCNKTTIKKLDEQDAKVNFVAFAQKWMDTNNLSLNSIENGQPKEFDELADVAQHPEVSPVAAVLGGILGNEVIKSFTKKGEPANNVLIFSGLDGGCRSFVLCPAENR